MQGKRLLVGLLGLLVGLAWLALLLAQGPRLSLALKVLGSTESVVFRLSVLPSLVLAAAATLLTPLLVVGGAGALLGVQGCAKVLRTGSQIGLAASASVVFAFGVAVLPTFGIVMGPGHALELAGAANLLVLHGALLWLLTPE